MLCEADAAKAEALVSVLRAASVSRKAIQQHKADRPPLPEQICFCSPAWWSP